MLEKLPGWVVSNADSVRRECAPYRSLTPAARATVLGEVSRASWRQIVAHPDAERIVRIVDPLPASSVAAWARLRRAAHARLDDE